MGDDNWKRIVKQIAADGWLGIGWPTEYGGQNRSPIEQLIFFDETQRAEAPVPMLSINTVGPTIMAFGTDEQKDRFLPGILAGELNFAIGYTEPGSGTDLASLQTRAVRDGDEYVINGQKIYTSLAAHADYIWLAARTDPEAPKHKGISIILVPTDAPGVDIQPLDIMAIGDTTATFYDDVRVPVTNRVGEENAGWSLITSQLNYERVAICNAGMIWRYLEEVTRFAQEHDDPDGGGKLIDREWVRLALARVRSNAEVLQLLNWKVAVRPDRGWPRPVGGVGHEGVRHRGLHRDARSAHGDRRADLVPDQGLARRRAAGPDGAQLPGHPRADLRWRHQRDPARHHRHARLWACPAPTADSSPGRGDQVAPRGPPRTIDDGRQAPVNRFESARPG